MASKKEQVPVYAQAVISKCVLCDRGEARYFCQECQEDICKQCKSIHLRSKFTRNHTVITSAIEVDEEEPVFCTSHPQEETQMHCNDCNVPVCLTCIADKKHPNHDLVKITDAVDECRKELSKCISDKKQDISELEVIVKSISNNKREYESQHNETIEGINKRREELKSRVDKAADNLIKETKKHKNQDVAKLDRDRDNINRIISDERVKVESCEEMLETERGFPVIKLSTEFKQKLDLGQSRNLPITTFTAPIFVCDTIDIQGVFGRLESGSKTYEKATGGNEIRDGQNGEKKTSGNKDQTKDMSTTIDTTTVADIDPGIRSFCVSYVNDKDAWVANGMGARTGDLAMIHINGQVKKRQKMNFSIWDIAVTSDGLLLTEYNGHGIKKYTENGQCVDVINTSPSNPWGICMTSHNDILVCLQGTGGSRVVRMTTQGQVKQTITQFTRPYLITENINGDVCVVDNYLTVVVVNKDGVLRFMYPHTKGKSSNTITECKGIVCDGLGFILISDLRGHQIHQLDVDGRFVQFILTIQHGIQYPWGLSIDTTGKLWVCNDRGFKVSVIKYRS